MSNKSSAMTQFVVGLVLVLFWIVMTRRVRRVLRWEDLRLLLLLLVWRQLVPSELAMMIRSMGIMMDLLLKLLWWRCLLLLLLCLL